MIVPKPFSRVVVAYGPELEPPRADLQDPAGLERWRARMMDAMAQAHAVAAAELARWRGHPGGVGGGVGPAGARPAAAEDAA
jgi:hypothetical protein